MHIKEINIKYLVYKYYFDNLIKDYKDLVIYFTRYIHNKLRRMLYLYSHELMRKVKEGDEKST